MDYNIPDGKLNRGVSVLKSYKLLKQGNKLTDDEIFQFEAYFLDLNKHVAVKDILVQMGIYYQIQDDYLDCFGDPKIVGKYGSDVEDFKCSWLVVKALELGNDEQKKISQENYGQPNTESVAKVKALYRELDLQEYEKLIDSIEAQPSEAVKAVLKSLGKIYKRQR